MPENLVLTPHIAWDTVESYDALHKEVTDEVVILPASERIPLSASDETWAQAIAACDGAKIDRARSIVPVQQAGYDINVETEKLTELYLKWAERKRAT